MEEQLLPRARVAVAELSDRDSIAAAAEGATILVVGAVEPLDAETLARIPSVVAVIRRGIGVDNIDLDAARRLGILVGNVPAASVEEVSDHALALLLAGLRRLSEFDAAARATDGAATARIGSSLPPLSSTTLGIVGFGRIGRALARKARSVFGEIIACDPLLELRSMHDSVRIVPLDEVVARSDAISLHAPGGAVVIDERALRAVRPGVVIVNTARGSLVDEVALARAVADGRVGAVGLDVTLHEPLADEDPLRTLPGAILTGHAAAKGKESAASLRRGVIDNIEDVLDGRSPRFLANPDVLESARLRLAVSTEKENPR
ncbi:NAD(P)-dependent oxidoreductase [Microcella sp.]|uniref:NAD(P)-dependent oxidoreductase n=1 Tax=Microcella sp. TaxID=1913979 RepID=UPI00331475A0